MRPDVITHARYASRVESIPAARRHVDHSLDWAPRETRSAIVLMVSELTTNAVRHSNSATFEVTVEAAAERVRVRVTDDGGGTPIVRAPSITDPSGRGLRIVAQLSDRFGIELTRDTTSVWFEVVTGSPPSVGSREHGREGRQVAEPDTTNVWWADVETFEMLAEQANARLRDAGAAATAIGVVDVLGDPHFASVPRNLSPQVGDALGRLVRDGSDSSVVTFRGPAPATTWHARALSLQGRTVGSVAWLSGAHDGLDDLPNDIRDELALATDVVAARFSSRRLRKGLGALRSIGADISRALSAHDVAASSEGEAKAALGAKACYLYKLTPAGLELVIDDRSDGEPWALIALERATPVTDCLRERHPVICPSRRSMHERYPWIAEHHGVDDQAWAAFPLAVEDRHVGALFFACAEPRTWTADELDVAATIANQCAQALARLELQARLDALRDERSESRLRAALDAVADLVAIESAVRDDEGRITDFRIEYINHADIDVAGRATDDLTGRLLSDAYPAAAATELLTRFADVVDTGQTFVVEGLPYSDVIEGEPVHGSYSMHVTKFGDGVIVSARRTPA